MVAFSDLVEAVGTGLVLAAKERVRGTINEDRLADWRESDGGVYKEEIESVLRSVSKKLEDGAGRE